MLCDIELNRETVVFLIFWDVYQGVWPHLSNPNNPHQPCCPRYHLWGNQRLGRDRHCPGPLRIYHCHISLRETFIQMTLETLDQSQKCCTGTAWAPLEYQKATSVRLVSRLTQKIMVQRQFCVVSFCCLLCGDDYKLVSLLSLPDLSARCETVQRKILLEILPRFFGIDSTVLHWFASCFVNRAVCFCWRHAFILFAHGYRVPQCSVLWWASLPCMLDTSLTLTNSTI